MANQKNQNTQSGTSARQARQQNDSAADSVSQNNQDPNISTESIKDSAKESAKGLYDQAKDTAGQAYGAATQKAESALQEQKTSLAGGLTSVADSLHQVSESLRGTDAQSGITQVTAKYGDRLAEQIEQVSDYFENRDARGMIRDVEGFARRNPEIFIGAAFTLGLLAARFLKSSGKDRNLTGGSPGSGKHRPAGEKNTVKTIDTRSVNTGENVNTPRNM